MEVDESIIDFTIEELTINKNNIHYLNFLYKFKTLKLLYCGYNNLTNLPELPNTLTHLYCSSNNLNSLPELPINLTHLYCSNNNLSSLPELPNTLTHLYCGYNNLSSLPELPISLKYFNYKTINSQEIIKLNVDRVKHHHSLFITEFMSTRFKILMSPSRISRLIDLGYLALDSQSGWDDI